MDKNIERKDVKPLHPHFQEVLDEITANFRSLLEEIEFGTRDEYQLINYQDLRTIAALTPKELKRVLNDLCLNERYEAKYPSKTNEGALKVLDCFKADELDRKELNDAALYDNYWIEDENFRDSPSGVNFQMIEVFLENSESDFDSQLGRLILAELKRRAEVYVSQLPKEWVEHRPESKG